MNSFLKLYFLALLSFIGIQPLFAMEAEEPDNIRWPNSWICVPTAIHNNSTENPLIYASNLGDAYYFESVQPHAKLKKYAGILCERNFHVLSTFAGFYLLSLERKRPKAAYVYLSQMKKYPEKDAVLNTIPYSMDLTLHVIVNPDNTVDISDKAPKTLN